VPLLDLKDIKMWYEVKRGLFRKPAYIRAVDDVSLSLEEGEALALIGESGCGKTTLGKVCLRLLKPTAGRVLFEGRDVTDAPEKEMKWFRRRTAAVFQDPYSSIDPIHTILYTLEEPLVVHKIGDKKERFEHVQRALEMVKMTPPEDFLPKYPHMLSGGQRQRVAIARAMILNPKFVVADEPITMLDASVRVEILMLLKEFKEKMNVSFLYVTHDMATAKYFTHRAAIMYAGKIVEIGSFRDLIHNPMHPYTRALIDVIPEPDPSNRFAIRKVAPGEPPNLLNPPPGCRFHPRCPESRGVCSEEEPGLSDLGGQHYVACHLY